MVVRVFSGHPSTEIEQTFQRIHIERMAGLPVCNEALRVEAVGFEVRDQQWLGVLVTPWSMNLMLLPADVASWVSAPEGRRLMVRYPAGEFPFLGGEEPPLGEYLVSPLFASMAPFADQETVRLTAMASLIALFRSPHAGDDDTDKAENPSRRRLFSLGS